MSDPTASYDPRQKEVDLQRESQAWEIGEIQAARPGDIPVIDLSRYFESDSDSDLDLKIRKTPEP